MGTNESVWYMEHVSSGRKIFLRSGENWLGNIVLQEYDFLSRNHAKITVNIDGVILEQQKTLNEVFINQIKLLANTQVLQLGDRIGFGVETDTTCDVPLNYAIFVLKEMCTNPDQIIVISDEESDDEIMKNSGISGISIDGLKITDIKANRENIHLPKLSHVKQEFVSETSARIENIFGEPDEDFLKSVYQINPYVFKKLNYNGFKTSVNQICDGDIIDLPKEEDYNEFDDNFSQLQELLQEIKEEMADSPFDSDEFKTNVNNCQMPSNLNQQAAIPYVANEDDRLMLMEQNSKLDNFIPKIFNRISSENKGHSEVIQEIKQEIPSSYFDFDELKNNENICPMSSAPGQQRVNKAITSYEDNGLVLAEQYSKSNICISQISNRIPFENYSHFKERNITVSRKSFVIDQEERYDTRDSLIARSVHNDCPLKSKKGPTIIKAPQLPQSHGKLRGVSSKSLETDSKSLILDKQCKLDHQSTVKANWDQEIREKHREVLNQIEKSKHVSYSPLNVLKRKPTNVPTVLNSNRGEFLTIEIEPSVKKIRGEKCVIKEKKKISSTAKSTPSWASCLKMSEKESAIKRKVTFNDFPQVIYIESVPCAVRKVDGLKDTNKFVLSRYADRRALVATRCRENFTDLIWGDILSWCNQWLLCRSADEVVAGDILMPIPSEFDTYKQYKDTFVTLMKLELLTTIEREYKLAKLTFEATLQYYSADNERMRPRYSLVTRCNHNLAKSFQLYSLSNKVTKLDTFAVMLRTSRIGGNAYEMTFEILQAGFSSAQLDSIKKLTVRPIVDNMRMELGAFTALYKLEHSPLFQCILKPSTSAIPINQKLLSGVKYVGPQQLNKQQLEICLSTWIRLIDDSTPSVTLIHGPPGTGKSALISNLILQCLYGRGHHKLDRKILVCAHSNAAVDNMTLYLSTALAYMNPSQFELIRFGRFQSMSERARKFTLEHRLSQVRAEKLNRLTPENIEILREQSKKLMIEISELQQRSAQVNYVQLELELHNKELQLRQVNQQLISVLTIREEFELSKKYIERANIVCTTLSSCEKLASFVDYFDICIIEEATQCTEPWTLLPLKFGIPGLVLVGDTKQLPATVLSQKAKDFGLRNSMFDRIQRSLRKHSTGEFSTKIFKLNIQHRMHPEICKFPNKYFYENQLVNADSTLNLVAPIIPYCMVNLSYTSSTTHSNGSISNYEEACFVSKLLIELNKKMSADKFKYGIITPYSQHCRLLQQLVPLHIKVTLNTVDACQGQQRDVIILSNARTHGVGFLVNYQRLIVGLTRSRRSLIICGNFQDLEQIDQWRHLINDARNRKVYFNVERADVDNLDVLLINKLLR